MKDLFEMLDRAHELDEKVSLQESPPLNGTGLVLDYNKEAKNLVMNVKEMINSKRSFDSVYGIIENNIQEDINYKARFYARHGIELETVINCYEKCIKMFADAYPERTTEKNNLDALLTRMKEIISETPSCKV